MTLTNEQITQLVSHPSLGAVSYQACCLIEELGRINDEEYPTQACKIRDIFFSIVEHIKDELWKLYDPNEPLVPKGGEDSYDRILDLASYLYDIYAYIRYLSASSPRQTPPAIQSALSHLTELHFRSQADVEHVCVIRPQWKYNLAYVPLDLQLLEKFLPSILDIEGELSQDDEGSLLPSLWVKWRSVQLERNSLRDLPQQPPKHIAILSFAGLDTSDALQYPLLAHELGHFIDFSQRPRLYERPEITEESAITEEQVKKVLEQFNSQRDVAQEWNKVTYLTNICLRELLADLLAVRMMGLAFFAAHSEFLKIVQPWSKSPILPTGYPDNRFRLREILDVLLEDSENGLSRFLKVHSESEDQNIQQPSNCLLNYLEKWNTYLQNDYPVFGNQSKDPVDDELTRLAEEAVRKALKNLKLIAREIIPDTKKAVLTDNFFKRIDRLFNDNPPSIKNESPESFAEICSAGWAYQIIYGEVKEIKEDSLQKKHEEYQKTCRLLLKAIELIPTNSNVEDVIENVAANNTQATTNNGCDKPKASGVLGSQEIRRRINDASLDEKQRLRVTPFDPLAIKSASLDVHLGNWFASAKRTRLKSIQLNSEAEKIFLERTGKDEVFIPSEKTFLLHPGDLALGITKEFFSLPTDIMAFVEGRSSLGRLGLFVATATQVAPTFHGVIVLELVNAGTVPLELKPGTPIAQLVFMHMNEEVSDDESYRKKGGRYYCQIKP